MNKAKLDILEKAFACQIDFSQDGTLFPFIQSKSKAAKELCAQEFLEDVAIILGNVTIRGYQLTLLGNFAYCSSSRCADLGDL